MTTDISTVIDLLVDADHNVRLGAAVDIGTRGITDAAPALVSQLGVDSSHTVRETLVWALLRMPGTARPLLHRALRDRHWLTRHQAAHALSKLADPLDIHALVSLVDDPVDIVAAKAWWAVAQTGDPNGASALTRQLGRGDSETRNSLSIALAALGESSVAPVVEALRRGGPGVREHAADTLGLIGSPRADPAALALAEAVADPEPTVRLAALNAVGLLDTPLTRFAVTTAQAGTDHRLAGLGRRLANRLPATQEGGGSMSTTQTLKLLRQRTGLGIMRCRAALIETKDDLERAERLLRAQPLAAAGTRADRNVREGLVAAADGVLVELLCETDFVAKSNTMRTLAQRLADLAATLPDPTRATLMMAPLDHKDVTAALSDLMMMTGERVELGRVEHLPGPTRNYLHATVSGLPPRIGALVSFEGLDQPVVHQILLQVAACDPSHLSRADVPADAWASLRSETEAVVRSQGKPEALVERIVTGKLAAWATEHVLLDQVSIADPGVTIDGLLYGRGLRITGFRRLEVGRSAPPVS